MTHIRRATSVSSPKPATTESSDVPATTQPAPAAPATTTTTVDELVPSAQAAAAALVPSLGKIDLALKSIADGTATIDVPLKAGEFKLNGVTVGVKKGTVVHIRVEVKNGEMVPIGKGHQGTSIEVVPPVDLPMWMSGTGIALEGDAAKKQFNIDMGGMFDVHFKSAHLSDLLSGHVGEIVAAAGAVLAPVADFKQMKVDAKVTLRDSTIDVGGLNVKVDPTTVLSLKSNGSDLSLSGDVRLDGLALDQGTARLSASNGQAHLESKMTRVTDGFAVESRLSQLKLEVDSFISSKPSAYAKGQTDLINLGKMKVDDGELRLTTKLTLKGFRTPDVHNDNLSFKIKGSGAVNAAQLTVKDAKDTAQFGFSGAFSGAIEMGPAGVAVDGRVTNAHVELADLQEAGAAHRLSINHARADGDLTIKTDVSSGSLLVDGQAKNIDLLVDGFTSTSDVKAELGKTSVSGSGSFHVGQGGVRVDGRLKGDAVIESLGYASTSKSARVGHSTISGELTNLALGAAGPTMRVERAKANVALANAKVDLGSMQLDGAGQVKGSGVVVFDAKGFQLQGHSQVGVTLDDGRVHSSTVDLDLAKGSRAELKIKNLTVGSTTSVALEPGSVLDASIDKGSVQVAGETVELEPGGRATFAIKSAKVGSGNALELRGSMQLDARMKAAAASFGALAHDGVRMRPVSADGRLKLSVDDAQLSDNRLSFNDAQLGIDLTVGRYLGAATAHAAVGSLQRPVTALAVDAVKAKTAAQIVGAQVQAAPAAAPLDALRLVKDGDLSVEVPLTGSIEALGVDVLTFPPGAKVALSLGVRDGQVIAANTKVTLTGVKALGVELLGVHADAHLKVHADVKIGGTSYSLPIPGLHVPPDMKHLADLVTGSNSAPSQSGTGAPRFVDLTHAHIDMTNAVFNAGRLSLPGGSVDVKSGTRLSFHGTPSAGDLVGNIGLDAVDVHLDDTALKGSNGRADLRVNYSRQGGQFVVDASLSNLSIASDYLAHKDERGDYFAVGPSKLTGATIQLRSKVAVSPSGLPRFDLSPTVEAGSVNVAHLSGELKSARVSSLSDDKSGRVELGSSRVDGSFGYTLGKGLSVKATVDQLDAALSGVKVQQRGELLDLDSARVQGKQGRIELDGSRASFDVGELAWDATIRRAGTAMGRGELQATQTRVSGAGRFSYDSRRDLSLEGRLHVDGHLAGLFDLNDAPQKVSVSRRTGLTAAAATER